MEVDLFRGPLALLHLVQPAVILLEVSQALF
jgi:hypothetical protein